MTHDTIQPSHGWTVKKMQFVLYFKFFIGMKLFGEIHAIPMVTCKLVFLSVSKAMTKESKLNVYCEVDTNEPISLRRYILDYMLYLGMYHIIQVLALIDCWSIS